MSERRRDSLVKPGWWLLIFTPFIGFVFLDPLQRHAGRIEWALTIGGVLVFYALYVAAMLFWSDQRKALAVIAGVTLLGFLFAPFNAGAALFIIYATSFIPYLVRGRGKPAAALIGAIVAIVLLETWVFHLHWVFWVYSVGYSFVLGIGGTWAAKQSFAVERLAKVAERERIARDLHDVLGHALSVIILKSELAGRLIDRDPGRAKGEIADVEKISRQALAEVRSTISGYRSEGLGVEFERAKSTLKTAGVSVQCDSEQIAITPAQEEVLTLALREAVTNVVRHARAANCHLRLLQVDGACRLEIQDDGQGGAGVEGYGLRGMRERIEAIGGTVMREGDAGTRLTVTVPLAARQPGGAS
jgi:two-component system, NarL family, sensor histidine kinase DesK